MEAARATIIYTDGTIAVGELERSPGSMTAGTVNISTAKLGAPTLRLLNFSALQADTSSTTATVRVSGAPGASLRVVLLEAALLVDGSGFDVDSYEGNTAVAVREYQGTIAPVGYLDVPVQLSKTGTTGGFNYLGATLSAAGQRSALGSRRGVLKLTP